MMVWVGGCRPLVVIAVETHLKELMTTSTFSGSISFPQSNTPASTATVMDRVGEVTMVVVAVVMVIMMWWVVWMAVVAWWSSWWALTCSATEVCDLDQAGGLITRGREVTAHGLDEPQTRLVQK